VCVVAVKVAAPSADFFGDRQSSRRGKAVGKHHHRTSQRICVRIFGDAGGIGQEFGEATDTLLG
jgi:hypothetical protein